MVHSKAAAAFLHMMEKSGTEREFTKSLFVIADATVPGTYTAAQVSAFKTWWVSQIADTNGNWAKIYDDCPNQGYKDFLKDSAIDFWTSHQATTDSECGSAISDLNAG